MCVDPTSSPPLRPASCRYVVHGTNNSLPTALIAARHLQSARELGAVRAEPALEAVKETGSLVVGLLEGLGETIDSNA